MISKVFFLLGTILLPFASSAVISECSGYEANALPIAFRSADCTGTTCQISLTSNIVFEVDAITPAATENLFTNLYIVLDEDTYLMAELPSEQYGCYGLSSGDCPLAANSQFTWGLNWAWNTESFAVGDNLTVQVAIYDDNDTPVTCFAVPVEIVA